MSQLTKSKTPTTKKKKAAVKKKKPRSLQKQDIKKELDRISQSIIVYMEDTYGVSIQEVRYYFDSLPKQDETH